MLIYLDGPEVSFVSSCHISETLRLSSLTRAHAHSLLPRSSAGIPNNSLIGILRVLWLLIALEMEICKVTVDANATLVRFCLPGLYKLKIVVKVYWTCAPECNPHLPKLWLTLLVAHNGAKILNWVMCCHIFSALVCDVLREGLELSLITI